MPYSSYNYLVNHLNFAMARDTNKAKLRVNNKLMPLLALLHHLGAVETYILFSETSARGRIDRYAIVTLTFFRTKPFLRNLKVCSKPSKHYTVTYRALKMASYHLGFSTMILSTSRGLLAHRDALRLREGGLLAAVVE
jgi:ribosomal protein S8